MLALQGEEQHSIQGLMNDVFDFVGRYVAPEEARFGALALGVGRICQLEGLTKEQMHELVDFAYDLSFCEPKGPVDGRSN